MFLNAASSLGARPIDEQTVQSMDWLVGMTRGHAMELILQFPQAAHKIVCMPSEIFDPYGGNEAVYDSCLQEIKQGVRELLAERLP